MADNVLNVKNREEFRSWLLENADTEKECWLVLKRGKPVDESHFWYIDAVYEAICFGWIDSTLGLIDNVRMQRFTPRAKNSSWTELNKERARKLTELGLMTEMGLKVLPDMRFTINERFKKDVENEGLWEKFTSFPSLYQRIRASYVSGFLKVSEAEYKKAFAHFAEMTRKGKMYGQWDDYGRLNSKMNVKLIKLTEEYKEELTEMIEEWTEYNSSHDTDTSPWAIFKNDCHDFDHYLENLETKEENGLWVPDSVFFLLDTDRNKLLGAVNIRHKLNEKLLYDGGHIGDGIRPSERRKGYATKMIELALKECKNLGIDRVLMVCDKTNIGSAKSIINNGGILENEVTDSNGNIEQRYWINL